jgi:hypothetical protein
VLLDGGTLDTLPYVLESAPLVDRILRDVYGVDLFNPPAESRHAGRIPVLATRPVWEARSLDDWQRIRREYGVTQVVTYAGWQLQLPAVAASRDLRLYDIPR